MRCLTGRECAQRHRRCATRWSRMRPYRLRQWTRPSRRTRLTKRYGRTIAVDELSIAVRPGLRHRVRRAERRREDDHDASAARSRRRGFRRGADPGEAVRDHSHDLLPWSARSSMRAPSIRAARHEVTSAGSHRATASRRGAPTRCSASSGSRRSPVGGRVRSRSECGSASALPPRCSATRRS